MPLAQGLTAEKEIIAHRTMIPRTEQDNNYAPRGIASFIGTDALCAADDQGKLAIRHHPMFINPRENGALGTFCAGTAERHTDAIGDARVSRGGRDQKPNLTLGEANNDNPIPKNSTRLTKIPTIQRKCRFSVENRNNTKALTGES